MTTKFTVADSPAARSSLRPIAPINVSASGTFASLGASGMLDCRVGPRCKATLVGCREPMFGRLAEQCQRHRAKVGELIELAGRVVALRNLTDANIAPLPRFGIDDFDSRLLSLQCANVERFLRHAVIAMPRLRSYDFAVHDEVQAGSALMVAAADPEDKKIALDRRTACS